MLFVYIVVAIAAIVWLFTVSVETVSTFVAHFTLWTAIILMFASVLFLLVFPISSVGFVETFIDKKAEAEAMARRGLDPIGQELLYAKYNRELAVYQEANRHWFGDAIVTDQVDDLIPIEFKKRGNDK